MTSYLKHSSHFILRWLFYFLIFILFGNCVSQTNKVTDMTKVGLVIHGGAGNMKPEDLTAEEKKQYEDKLQEALDAGYAILEKGGTSLIAVETVIKMLEDSPLFNAGKGAVLTNAETIELDASIMSGVDLKAGAVAGVTIVKNPISAARKVMENSPHVLLTGKGAEEFAKEQHVEIVDPSYFFTEKSRIQLQRIKESERKKMKEEGSADKTDKKFGTVGCVALDIHGNLAAGTSTGGMVNKKFGRVGDSPIIGAGTYADNNTCAVSCTGHGEHFIRNVIAYSVSALMEYEKLSLEKAADYAIHKKLKKTSGTGGLIAIDKDGNMAMKMNVSSMFRGYKNSRESKVFIFQ